MSEDTALAQGFTSHGNAQPRFDFDLVAGGTINPYRLVKMATDGDVEAAGDADLGVIGAYQDEVVLEAGDPVEVSWGPCILEAEGAIVAGQRLKAAAAGRAVQLVDSELAGSEILAATAGVQFTNQPADDGVEVISDDAGDVQQCTIYGTTDGTDTVVKETITLLGLTQKATTKTDWGVILAVTLSSVAIGTVTVREASANQTIVAFSAGESSKGVVAATSPQAYNQAPTIVSDGSSTKQIGLIGTDANGDEELDSQALNSATAVTMNEEFQTVTSVLVGDLETARTVAVAVGAEEDENLGVGKALEAASAQDDKFLALVVPR